MNKLLSHEEAVIWLRQQPGQSETVRANFFDDPLAQAAQRYVDSTEWRAVREFLPSPPGKALDIGAGRGIASYALTRDGWATTALEPDGSSIVGAGAIRSLAVEAGLKIEVIEAAGEKLPFPDSSFDLVHCRQVLHHVRDLHRTCREIRRVLKPGGIFIATREHVISRKEDLPVFLANHLLHPRTGAEHAYLSAEYIAAIRDAGLMLVCVLNTSQSDINLYPETTFHLKARIAAKLMFPFPGVIPRFVLSLHGALSRIPGRPYTFVSRNPGQARIRKS